MVSLSVGRKIKHPETFSKNDNKGTIAIANKGD